MPDITHELPALPEPIAKAKEIVQSLIDFAYSQGFHELGYDPLQALLDAYAEESRLPLLQEIQRLTVLYEMAVKGRQDMRSALRQERAKNGDASCNAQD